VTTLTVPAVLALIAANHCVSPMVAPVMVGISQHESGLNPFLIHDNATGRAYTPDTTDDARRLAAKLIAAGHDLDLGIAQINVRNLAWTGLTVASAFDACRSLDAGARVLFAKYNGSPPESMRAAYAASVTDEIHALDAVADPPGPSPPSAPAADDTDLHDAVHVHRSLTNKESYSQ
jgi:hypothetical protein